MSGSELLDVVDSSGQPCGIIKPRESVHRHGDWHKTVHIWIVNKNGELLFQKRSSNKESFPGVWDVSSAGHISAGETSPEGAGKEVLEELGVKIAKRDFSYLFTIKNSCNLHNGSFIDNEFSDVYLVKKDFLISDLSLQPSEVSDARYIHYAILKKIADTGDPLFAPHPEEYMRLFEYLACLKNAE
jgi:isopentenyldiphosphate isomerase